MPEVKLYTKLACVSCHIAKGLLHERDIRFVEETLDDPLVLMAFKNRHPNIKTVPAVFVDGEHIGGYKELWEWTKSLKTP